MPSPIYDDKTVYDDWLADLQRGEPDLAEPSLALLGTGSDYTAFFHHLGIPSIDMIFNRQGQGVYPYHSNYDSYLWLDRFGDVGFNKHKAMAQLWGLVAVKLAGVDVIPFTTADYAKTLSKHFANLKAENEALDGKEFEEALANFGVHAKKFDERVSSLRTQGQGDLDAVNCQLIALERTFLLEKGSGLAGRP